MVVLAIIIILIFAVLILFSFPQLSPIPYFPSNPKDMKLIMESLQLKNNQVVIDLGAGDGVIIFKAAEQALQKNVNTLFIAVETNPILLAIIWVRWLFHKNRKHIFIMWKDMFNANYKKMIASVNVRHDTLSPTFYLYISPWLIKKAIEQIEKSIDTFNVVSYLYAVPSWKPKKVLEGRHKVHIYTK
jgi:16S rRNA A1518/A1519 N6-dimethyltransferase RsmA/KsgA/DIM1 with predicted DNA glycosylase/AP lyase activity